MIKPMNGRVVVSEVKIVESKTAGGIFVPLAPQDKDRSSGVGIVVEIGDSKISNEIKKGDKVIFGTYIKTEVTVDGEKYLMVKGDDILAVEEDV